VSTKIIDEDSGNPFPAQVSILTRLDQGMAPVSSEGYYHNDNLIMKTTTQLAKLIGLETGQRTIDVGFGVNLSVAKALRNLGMDSHGLDSQSGLDYEKYPTAFMVPPHFIKETEGIKTYCGTIEEIIHPQSQLRDTKFDLFTFWGSWESGGNNFAIGGEMGEFRIYEEHPKLCENGDKRNKLYQLMQSNRDKIISDSASILNPSGGILIVSSRYAGHGAGFATDQLPWEKRIMLRLGQTLKEKGAEEIYLVGLTNDTVQTQLAERPELSDVARELRDDEALFKGRRGVYETPCQEQMIRRIQDMEIPLGRIDAVYGRF